MPLYEYQCDACGHRFELIQKFSDPPAESCPTCGGPVRKLLSSPAVHFKGSGWYITDYARKGGSQGKGEAGAATGGEAGQDTTQKGTESKGTESKGAESKGAESKSTESKGAAAGAGPSST